MKTLDINATNQEMNRTREHIRLTMIVVGIVTAIICSLALLHEVQSAETSGSVSRMFETSKMIANSFSIQVVSKPVVSVLWPF
ncbi:MAG: hypothetical protein ABI663_21295 [Chryseolinea sp.]